MTKIISLFLLLYTQQALASWSGYAVVTPESQSEYEVDIKAVVSPSGICTVKFKAIGYPDKHAWLILTSSKLSNKEQKLRNYLWEDIDAPPNLVLKSKINPAIDKLNFLDNENVNDAYYEIKITNKISHSAYIYIDFPHPVNDGGYYYSIDLGAYCGW
jgi:hypothetical protein